MNNTESQLFDLLWTTNVDRRINAALTLDRSIRKAVESLSTLLADYLNNSNGKTQPRQIQEAAKAIDDLSGLLVELDLAWNVRLPALKGRLAPPAGD
jgi:hypothetical protein